MRRCIFVIIPSYVRTNITSGASLSPWGLDLLVTCCFEYFGWYIRITIETGTRNSPHRELRGIRKAATALEHPW